MCDNAVDNYAHALESVPDFYKTQKICNKAVSYSAKQFVLDRFKTQETFDKSADSSPFVFDSVPGRYSV